MRLIFTFLIILYIGLAPVHAQVVIKDSLFLEALIDYGVDSNDDGMIQMDEAEAVRELVIEGVDVKSIEGIEAFKNLNEVVIQRTLIDSADLRGSPNITSLRLSDNDINYLRLDGLSKLRLLRLRSNKLDSLDLTGFPELVDLDVYNNKLSNMDLSNSSFLTDLDISNNNFRALDLSGAVNLLRIETSNNPLEGIDFSSNTRLRNIQTSNCNISEIDVKHLKDLISLVVTNCPIKTLDVAGLEKLFTLWLNDSSIETLFMKGTTPDPSQLQFDDAPLKFICADREIFPRIHRELDFENIEDCLVTSICPYTDEGVFGGISGRVKFGQNQEDCDTSTNFVPHPRLHMEWLNPNGRDLGVLVGPKDGSYSVNYYGTMTLRPGLTHAPEWRYTDTEFTASNSKNNPQNRVKDFCMVPAIDRKDSQISLIPLQAFRAGFVSELLVLIRNTGTQPLSGNLTLHLPKDTLTYISSSEVPVEALLNDITWQVDDLLPFQEKRIKVVMRLNSPVDDPPIIGREAVGLCATIDDIDQYSHEECIEDITVNSFDPNDKTYLGRDTVRIDEVAQLNRLTYLIRFENTGNAEAENIVIADTLDKSFIDILSLDILDASHPVQLEMQGDGVVEFLFKDINLPFQKGANTGYVLFSVYTRWGTVEAGDQFTNKAGIYFDFNYPIITNDAKITVVDIMSSTSDRVYLQSLKAFPNPFYNKVKIQTADELDGEGELLIYDINGRIIDGRTVYMNRGRVLLSNLYQLDKGNYYFEINVSDRSYIAKVIKK